jgi:FMN-dependent NADH-azoreductase
MKTSSANQHKGSHEVGGPSVLHINSSARMQGSNTRVLGTPMYNFGIPAAFKQWIDAICRAGVSFKYAERGSVGLLGVKRAA